ncbi:MAG: transcription antitermination factor NusB, partial [Thermodesulfobacteriota bacterium]
MRRKEPREICLEILNQVEQTDEHPDQLITHSFKRYPHLTPLDRAFVTELTYGVLRWRGRIDWILQQFSHLPFEKIEPKILNILRLGLYQILFLSKTPFSASVHESVELAKKIRGRGGGGFVNAVLRSFLRKKDDLVYPDLNKYPDLYLSIVQSHPLWLAQKWMKEMGVEKTMEICLFNNEISPLILRTNTLKMDRKHLIEKLIKEGLKPYPTLYSDEGIILKESPPISELPFIHEGFYVLQEEASQLVAHILDPRPGEKILDACAGPGGKTTHLAQRMENRGEIYALDLSKKKLNVTEKRCHELGIKIVKT